jgi:hypothetical protein
MSEDVEMSQPVTRGELKAELQEFRAATRTELKAELQEFRAATRTELKAELQTFRTELRAELKTEIKTEIKKEIKKEIDVFRVEIDARFHEVHADLARHANAIMEAVRTEMRGFWEPVKDVPGRVDKLEREMGDVPARVTRLEAAVFPPKRPKRRRRAA